MTYIAGHVAAESIASEDLVPDMCGALAVIGPIIHHGLRDTNRVGRGNPWALSVDGVLFDACR